MGDQTTEIIRPAAEGDAVAVLKLLAEAELPAAGVTEWLPHFFVAVRTSGLAGVAGLEIHGEDGLLRSVAVREMARGEGTGRRLTRKVIESARSRRLRRLYLLTTTAEDYFPHHGFRRIRREDISPEVQNSVEFKEACPASAAAMVLDLRPRAAPYDVSDTASDL